MTSHQHDVRTLKHPHPFLLYSHDASDYCWLLVMYLVMYLLSMMYLLICWLLVMYWILVMYCWCIYYSWCICWYVDYWWWIVDVLIIHYVLLMYWLLLVYVLQEATMRLTIVVAASHSVIHRTFSGTSSVVRIRLQISSVRPLNPLTITRQP